MLLCRHLAAKRILAVKNERFAEAFALSIRLRGKTIFRIVRKKVCRRTVLSCCLKFYRNKNYEKRFDENLSI